MPITLNYGLDLVTSRLIHVDASSRGIDCGLVCSNCKGSLVAKQGDVRRWHFAHSSGIECVGAVETALHLRAKEIIADSGWLLLPPLTVNQLADICRRANQPIDTGSIAGDRFWSINRELLPSRPVSFSSASIEKRIELDGRSITADIILHGDHDIVVEIHVAHAVDEEKARALQAANYTALEIRIEQPTDTAVNDAQYVNYVLTQASRKFLSLSMTEIQTALKLVPSPSSEQNNRSMRSPASVEFVEPEVTTEPARQPWRSWRPVDNSKLLALQREYATWASSAELRRASLESTIRDLRLSLGSMADDSRATVAMRRILFEAEAELRLIEIVHPKRSV